jgi:hypothetical protein
MGKQEREENDLTDEQFELGYAEVSEASAHGQIANNNKDSGPVPPVDRCTACRR